MCESVAWSIQGLPKLPTKQLIPQIVGLYNLIMHVLAVSLQADTRQALKEQLSHMDGLVCLEVIEHLADATAYWQKNPVDLMIVDLTEQELDACLFIETINYKVENKTVVFGLHKTLDPSLIIKAVSSGVKEFIHYPQDKTSLALAFEKHAKIHKKTFSADNGDEGGKLLAVFSAKGGTGCSTIAANLAQELTQQVGKRRVLLIDFDQSFVNLTGMLKTKANYALSDLEASGISEVDDGVLDQIISKHATGLDLIFACKHVLDDNPPLSEGLLVSLFAALKQKYRYIIVDLPTHVVDPYHQFIVSECHKLFVVCTPDIPTLFRTRQYIELLNTNLGLEKVCNIINRFDQKSVVGVSPEELEAVFRQEVFFRLPNQWDINVEAMSTGEFISQVAPNSQLSKAYKELAIKTLHTFQSTDVLSNSNETASANLKKGILSMFTRRANECHS